MRNGESRPPLLTTILLPPRDKTVTVYVYDQGISIPVSLPIVWDKDKAFASLLAKVGIRPWKEGQDGDAIRAAMRLSNTSTKMSNRGKGLHKIKEIIGLLEGGELTILSRRGHYKWQGNQECQNPHPSGFCCGTRKSLNVGRADRGAKCE